jgi:hypothetical protein
MAEELHQEFLLRLCEIGEIKIQEVIDEGYIDWFCMDVINKIWGKRFRVKSYDKGQTNPLFEFSNMSVDADLAYFTPDYNIDYDYNYTKAKDILNKDINSDNKDTNYKARVFTYSVGLSIKDGEIKEERLFKNALQFSKKSGINYPAIWKAVKEYKKYLKDKIK